MTTPTLRIDGRSLTLDAVAAVAERGATVGLSDAARTQMLASHGVVTDIVARNAVVYGVTTGFGSLAHVAVPAAEASALQHAIVRSHATAVGPFLSREEARAMLLLRGLLQLRRFGHPPTS